MHWDLRLRNRGVIVFLLPFMGLLWMVGWVLYSVGAQCERHRQAVVAVKDDGVEVAFVVPEKNVETDGQVRA
jgi:hypothetical protein